LLPRESGDQRFYLEGGMIDCVSVDVHGRPAVTLDRDAVFVLFPAPNSDGKPFGDRLRFRFVWPMVDGEVVTGDGRYSLDELAEKIAAVPDDGRTIPPVR
jgi:hypothetical protein